MGTRLLATASPTSTPKEVTVPSKTIGRLLKDAIDRWEHKDAFVMNHENMRWTWTELGQKVWPIASGLPPARFHRGDTVVSLVDGDSEQVVLPLATSLVDMIFSPVKPTATKLELENYLVSLRPKALVFPPRYRGKDNVALMNEVVPELSILTPESALRCKKFPWLRYLLQTDPIHFQHGIISLYDLRWMDPVPSPIPPAESILPSHPAMVYFNEEKGITFSHGALTGAAHSWAQHAGLSRDDRVCVTAPFDSSSFAFASGLLPCLDTGAVIVGSGAYFLPDVVLKCLARDSVTHLVCLPSQLEQLLKHPTLAQHDLSKLRSIFLGFQVGTAGPSVAQLLERAQSSLKHTRTVLAYYHPHVAGAFALSDGVSTELLPGLQAKVVNTGGTEVLASVRGELWLKGPLASGHWDPQTQRPVPTVGNDGWLHTGVVASRNSEGKLSF